MSWLKNNLKTVLFVVVVLFVVGGYLGVKQMYKPHKTVSQREVAFIGNTSDLLVKVKSNPAQWQDVIVVLEGAITNSDAKSVSLDNIVFCQLENSQEKIALGKLISVKGRIIGYDDLLEELKLDQTVIENN